MKIIGIFTIMLLLVGCDPYGFGFKKNPAYILDEVFSAISNLDTKTFLELSGKEALCIYGNDNGILYLKENILIDPENIKLKPTVLNTHHVARTDAPRFVGYWSYYHERYQVEILDKETSKVLMNAAVDCDYGTDLEKNKELYGLAPKEYKKKECRLTKIVPSHFMGLQLPSRCDSLKVQL